MTVAQTSITLVVAPLQINSGGPFFPTDDYG
ncbi:hypothetical protein DLJ82_6263 (plasmid) [Rhizobium leguminosarum]|uniref:Uncharacterized protein n=1 Tax=Rhizobium leguminosarum TaxID=384 RepID=A0A2Z4YS89_RHILE|nr:hypothetical protein DLJ82_6263 [Rhizobium leguminosarum]